MMAPCVNFWVDWPVGPLYGYLMTTTFRKTKILSYLLIAKLRYSATDRMQQIVFI